MGMFKEFRSANSNTFYESRRTPVLVDTTQILVIYFFVSIAFALLILVIGSRGRERWATLLKLVFSFHTSFAIFLTLFGYGWQTGSISTSCEYSATYKGLINAKIGLHIALKSFNITLAGDVNTSSNVGSIDYNERFNMDKVSSIIDNYIQELRRGLPWPLLHVAEYMYEDRGGLRWMRFYHEAGHFTYIILWCALIFWAMGNMLLGFVVSRGAFLITCSGLSMAFACIVYDFAHPTERLVVILNGNMLTLQYGWCFWLCLVSGIITTCFGITVLVVLFLKPTSTNLFFLIDTSSFDEDKYFSSPLLSDAGPLQIKSPYTERRDQINYLVKAYSNPAYAEMTGGRPLTKRSLSFDLGAYSRQSDRSLVFPFMSPNTNQSECSIEESKHRVTNVNKPNQSESSHAITVDQSNADNSTSQVKASLKRDAAITLENVPEEEEEESEYVQKTTSFMFGEKSLKKNGHKS